MPKFPTLGQKLDFAYTAIPDYFLDHIAPTLKEGELKVMLYIFRRTLGYQKLADTISYDQFLTGITKRDGRRLNQGAGVSRRALVTALASLEERGLIERCPSTTTAAAYSNSAAPIQPHNNNNHSNSNHHYCNAPAYHQQPGQRQGQEQEEWSYHHQHEPTTSLSLNCQDSTLFSSSASAFVSTSVNFSPSTRGEDVFANTNGTIGGGDSSGCCYISSNSKKGGRAQQPEEPGKAGKRGRGGGATLIKLNIAACCANNNSAAASNSNKLTPADTRVGGGGETKRALTTNLITNNIAASAAAAATTTTTTAVNAACFTTGANLPMLAGSLPATPPLQFVDKTPQTVERWCIGGDNKFIKVASAAPASLQPAADHRYHQQQHRHHYYCHATTTSHTTRGSSFLSSSSEAATPSLTPTAAPLSSPPAVVNFAAAAATTTKDKNIVSSATASNNDNNASGSGGSNSSSISVNNNNNSKSSTTQPCLIVSHSNNLNHHPDFSQSLPPVGAGKVQNLHSVSNTTITATTINAGEDGAADNNISNSKKAENVGTGTVVVGLEEDTLTQNRVQILTLLTTGSQVQNLPSTKKNFKTQITKNNHNHNHNQRSYGGLAYYGRHATNSSTAQQPKSTYHVSNMVVSTGNTTTTSTTTVTTDAPPSVPSLHPHPSKFLPDQLPSVGLGITPSAAPGINNSTNNSNTPLSPISQLECSVSRHRYLLFQPVLSAPSQPSALAPLDSPPVMVGSFGQRQPPPPGPTSSSNSNPKKICQKANNSDRKEELRAAVKLLIQSIPTLSVKEANRLSYLALYRHGRSLAYLQDLVDYVNYSPSIRVPAAVLSSLVQADAERGSCNREHSSSSSNGNSYIAQISRSPYSRHPRAQRGDHYYNYNHYNNSNIQQNWPGLAEEAEETVVTPFGQGVWEEKEAWRAGEKPENSNDGDNANNNNGRTDAAGNNSRRRPTNSIYQERGRGGSGNRQISQSYQQRPGLSERAGRGGGLDFSKYRGNGKYAYLTTTNRLAVEACSS